MAKTTAERIAELEAQLLQKKARLARLKAKETAAERKRDTRRKIIVGAAVLMHAETDAAFAKTLAAVLKKAVVRESDLETIADLLPHHEKA